MKKIYLVLISLFLLANLSFSSVPVEIEGVENFGMGGPGTAFSNKYGELYNPALLGLKQGFHLTLIDLPFSISNDIFKFYSFYKDNQDALENFGELSQAESSALMSEIADKVTKYKVRLRASALNPRISMGPFPLYGSGLNIGVGVYNQVDAGAKLNAGILVPNIDLWARVDAVLLVPVSYKFDYLPMRLPGELYAGASLKYIMRSRLEENRMSIFEFENYDIDADKLEPGSGFGLDLGALYNFSDRWNFSFVIKDFMSTRIGYNDGSSEVIKGRVCLGAAYKLNKMFLFAADLRDIKLSDVGKSTLFTKLYMGGEASLLGILKGRAGFYQGYPSIGFGLGGVLSYAYYGRELSAYPGLDPEYNHVISLTFGF